MALTAALVAMLLWWFFTGAILVVVRLTESGGAVGGQRATILALPFLFLGAYGFLETLSLDTVLGTYAAFLSGLALWGWIELSFLTGTITGPVKTDCPPNCGEWERFVRAWGTVAYHEIALTVLLLFALLASQGAENTFGFWTIAVLYFARISAKLNLFLGVAHINTEFLPSHLAHLASHFRTATMNALFPVSITVLTFALACWLERLIGSESPFGITGFALLASLTALALLEHWFLMLPLPDAKLWRWMLPSPRTHSKKRRTS